jgi:hypothetical protein
VNILEFLADADASKLTELVNLERALVAAVATLTGVVGYFFRMFEKRLTACEDDRKLLWQKVAEISEDKPRDQ